MSSIVIVEVVVGGVAPSATYEAVERVGRVGPGRGGRCGGTVTVRVGRGRRVALEEGSF